MTTTDARADATRTLFRLPEPRERDLDEMTSYRYVYGPGAPINLLTHFGNPESTLVGADMWMTASPGSRPLLQPDLIIAFDIDVEQYYEQNGYVISDQGKPPDFVLEVASPSTAERDTGYKRIEYARMGVTEYWRFDHTGEDHGTRLAGDRLVGASYQPIAIVEVAPDILEGRSDTLNLILRWNHGQMLWIDPVTQVPIPGLESERAARIEAELQAERAEQQARRAQMQADRAEARARELEAELRRLQQRPD